MSEEKKKETYGPQKEENYFKKKLEISKDILSYTLSQLESADIQIKVLIQRHEYDLGIYNQKIAHLQQIETNTKKRLISLQKKIDAGFVAIDMNTGKGYKSRAAMHKAHLAQQAQESKDNYEKSKAVYVLKKKKGEIPKPVVEPPTGEVIESQSERELRLLKEKSDELEKQQQELKDKMKAEKKAAKKEVLTLDDLEKEIEDVVEVLDELKKDEDAEIILNSLGPIDETEINKDTITTEWIEEYEEETGKKAIWKGMLTNGFKDFIEAKSELEYKNE